MAKSLVTGGAGFIGSNLVDRLIEMGHEVICVDNESAECHDQFYWNKSASNHIVDICDYGSLEPLFEGVSNVFHIASDARIQPSIQNPRKSINSNVNGTVNVLELSRINKVTNLVYSSTSSAYGKFSAIPNVEIQPPDPLTPYSVSKVFGENLCRVYWNLYGLRTISLRYFNVYGNRQPLKGEYAPVIGLFLRQKKQNQPLTIVGDGLQRRDFTHISDVVEANILATLSKSDSVYGRTYNVGYGKNYSILEIANMISENITFLSERPGEVRETLASNELFKSTFDWEPKISISSWLSSILLKKQ